MNRWLNSINLPPWNCVAGPDRCQIEHVATLSKTTTVVLSARRSHPVGSPLRIEVTGAVPGPEVIEGSPPVVPNQILALDLGGPARPAPLAGSTVGLIEWRIRRGAARSRAVRGGRPSATVKVQTVVQAAQSNSRLPQSGHTSQFIGRGSVSSVEYVTNPHSAHSTNSCIEPSITLPSPGDQNGTRPSRRARRGSTPR